jgi:hypothetical protein
MCGGLRVNARYSCQTLTKLETSIQILEKHSNIMKICPVGAELFLKDEQTDEQHDEANIGFH